VRAQVLGVQAFQALFGHDLKHMRHVQQLPAGKDIALDEVADAGAELGVARAAGGDAVVQQQSAGRSRRRILSK
jgi:hypothetical protein